MKQKFRKNLMMCSILMDGEKFAFLGIYTLNFIQGKLIKGGFSSVPFEERVTENYIDGHNIDFLKGRIAFDLEWNSKDQTFDRDLLAMRTYYDCDIVSAGIIVTRSQELNDVFKTVYDLIKTLALGSLLCVSMEPARLGWENSCIV